MVYSKVLGSVSFCSTNDNDHDDETVIRGARFESSRLFFEPSVSRTIFDASANDEGEDEKKKKKGVFDEEMSIVGGVVVIESSDPYMDFIDSMEEMVVAHPWILHGWDSLERLLAYYLALNETRTHPFIVAAFVHLLSHSPLI